MKSARILGQDFAAMTTPEVVEWCREMIASGERGHVFTVNVAILMMLRSSPVLEAFARDAALVVADGQPLVWASRTGATPLPERVTGVDLVDELCAMAAREGMGVYFLGAKREVIERAAQNLASRHPGLEIAGVADGYFGSDEAPARAAAVATSGAKILFIGMGVPRQESFIQSHWPQLGAQLVLPVGGSFDVISGTAKRAPRFLQRIGMEWLFRLVQEPRRLWRRYLVTNTQFLFLMSKSALGLGPRRGDD